MGVTKEQMDATDDDAAEQSAESEFSSGKQGKKNFPIDGEMN